MPASFESAQLVSSLKAAAEPTRLRILVLLTKEELNVKDLTQILSQSQPRISRHLRLLVESGLIERFREGSWVYFHVSERTDGGKLVRNVLALLDPRDSILARDLERLHRLKQTRADNAQQYFEQHAGEWDKIRGLHVPEGIVEAAMLKALGDGPFRFLVDLGTGTGRVLELFSDVYEQGLGLDLNQTMLSLARAKLSDAGLGHADARHGDVYNVNLPDGTADAVVMHQVLHFLADPGHAIEEAARILAPGGRLLIVDFAPHDLEFLRREHAHERLGFTDKQMRAWIKAAGLQGFTSTTLDSSGPDEKHKLTVTVWSADQVSARARATDTHVAQAATAEEISR